MPRSHPAIKCFLLILGSPFRLVILQRGVSLSILQVHRRQKALDAETKDLYDKFLCTDLTGFV